MGWRTKAIPPVRAVQWIRQHHAKNEPDPNQEYVRITQIAPTSCISVHALGRPRNPRHHTGTTHRRSCNVDRSHSARRLGVWATQLSSAAGEQDSAITVNVGGGAARKLGASSTGGQVDVGFAAVQSADRRRDSRRHRCVGVWPMVSAARDERLGCRDAFRWCKRGDLRFRRTRRRSSTGTVAAFSVVPPAIDDGLRLYLMTSQKGFLRSYSTHSPFRQESPDRRCWHRKFSSFEFGETTIVVQRLECWIPPRTAEYDIHLCEAICRGPLLPRRAVIAVAERAMASDFQAGFRGEPSSAPTLMSTNVPPQP